jgi:hypothetical protein
VRALRGPRGPRCFAPPGFFLLAGLLGAGVGFAVHRFTAGTAAAPAIVTERYGMHGVAAGPAGTRTAPAIDTLRDHWLRSA